MNTPALALTVPRSSFIVPRSEMFITFEGIEGSGKTTQQQRIAERLRTLGRAIVVTKEPGGTPLADRIRAILLDSASVIDPIAEVFLFAASRRQHTMEVIEPALARGEIVLCDRYADSTLAYQGFGRRIDLDRLRSLNDWATDAQMPSVTLLFDLPEEVGVRRAVSRNANATNDEGRFEAEDLRFHRRVREGYLAMAVAEPKRWAVIDGDGSADEVFERTLAELQRRAPEVFA
ncbi:MAG TPA: dTMP kinase [Thermoanaerobaculia bacterium]|nr:dTMP kinase [Thermoanaerobaculia bacterium]